jgi:hypothetical protein
MVKPDLTLVVPDLSVKFAVVTGANTIRSCQSAGGGRRRRRHGGAQQAQG